MSMNFDPTIQTKNRKNTLQPRATKGAAFLLAGFTALKLIGLAHTQHETAVAQRDVTIQEAFSGPQIIDNGSLTINGTAAGTKLRTSASINNGGESTPDNILTSLKPGESILVTDPIVTRGSNGDSFAAFVTPDKQHIAYVDLTQLDQDPDNPTALTSNDNQPTSVNFMPDGTVDFAGQHPELIATSVPLPNSGVDK